MDLELHGNVAVITGGASGIGLACAQQLSREGCDVALWDVARDVSGVAADLAKQFGRRAIGIPVDVSKLESVKAALDKTENELGPVTHLVHSAAVTSGQFGFPFTNVATTSWQRVLDVNVMGMVHVAQLVAPGMISRHAGTMVFVASVAGQIGSQTDPPYSASKAAVIALTKSIGKERADTAICVNCVTPAAVKTPIFDQLTPEHIQFMLSKIPMGRFGTPEEIAAMVAWLCTDDCSFSTGAVFDLSGGRSTY